MPLLREERAEVPRNEVRRNELIEIANYCDFKFINIDQGTGTIKSFGNPNNRIEFSMGLTDDGEIKFKFWSNVDLRDKNMRSQIVRNWLFSKLQQQRVENATLDCSVKPVKKGDAQRNPEGYVAVYTVKNIDGKNIDGMNWKGIGDDQRKIVSNVFVILRDFFTKNVEENTRLNFDIETYNREHKNELDDYIDRKRLSDANNNLQDQVDSQPQDTDNSMIETIKNLLLNNHQVILTGAPGTGKTYTAQKVAEALTYKVAEALTDSEIKRICKVQFHPGYDYSDFVIGLKPKPENNQVVFSWEDGIFKKFADQAKNDENNNYVFIIDEINRADLSRVFGELFSILEEGYRGEGIILPNGNELVIPNNLYIIGTMNDIDRSVESMDFALRRRFAWYEVSAKSSECIIDNRNINNKDKDILKSSMSALNREIGNEAGSTLDLRLGKEYQLGGALFAKFEKLGTYDSLWNNVIKIILNEYLRGRNNREKLLQDLEEIFKLSQGNANQSSEANVVENQER